MMLYSDGIAFDIHSFPQLDPTRSPTCASALPFPLPFHLPSLYVASRSPNDSTSPVLTSPMMAHYEIDEVAFLIYVVAVLSRTASSYEIGSAKAKSITMSTKKNPLLRR